MNQEQYKCQIYSAKQSLLFNLSALILLMALIAFISLRFDILILFPIGFVISLLLPFIFQKKIKRNFTREAFLKFDESSFTIESKKINNGEKCKVLKYNWDDISAYKFYFTPSKLTYLDIYFKKGGWKEFGFVDNKTEEESINSESIFSIFRSFVKQYNLNRELNEKIALKKGFLTTNKGTFLMLLVGVLILLATIFALFLHPKSFPFLLMSIFIFIPLLIKRKQDKKFYEKMRNL